MFKSNAAALAWIVVIAINACYGSPVTGSSTGKTSRSSVSVYQICIPDTIYAVVGRPLDIRYEQLIAQIPETSDVSYYCQSGSGCADSSGFHYKPDCASTDELAIGVITVDGKTIYEASTHIRAVSITPVSPLHGVLFVGDSIIAAHPSEAPESSYVVSEFLSRIESAGGEGVRLIGSAGEEPGLHEGYNGKRWIDFTSPSSAYFNNPFWDPTQSRIDFQRYMTATGQSGPIDYCIIQLGYNDVFCLFGEPLTEQIMAQWTERIDAFCRSLLSEETGYPDCRIVLSLPSSGNGRTSAWIDDYHTLDHWEAFERNMAIYRHALKDRYDQRQFDDRVSVCGAGVSLDRWLDYYDDNYLHPNPSGYEATAEAFYAHFNALWFMEHHSTGTAPLLGEQYDPSIGIHPNPFNPSTTIRYRLENPGLVNIVIYDIRGHRVKTLLNGAQEMGYGEITWNGTNDMGQPMASGVYVMACALEGRTFMRRVTLAR